MSKMERDVRTMMALLSIQRDRVAFELEQLRLQMDALERVMLQEPMPLESAAVEIVEAFWNASKITQIKELRDRAPQMLGRSLSLSEAKDAVMAVHANRERWAREGG